MRILVFNAGSSSLKSKLYDLVGADTGEAPTVLSEVLVERIGGAASMRVSGQGATTETQAAVPDQGAALRVTLEALDAADPAWRSGLAATGHRIVHGGLHFREVSVLDEDKLIALEALSEIAPLHNGPALEVVRRSRELLGEALPVVAAFDTSFHQSLPPYAARYAIPRELTEKYAIYRYGFHGLAHQYMAERLTRLSGDGGGSRFITLQLGNGCSVTAVRDGRSIDTSMGFTPLEGLMMGTRSGDLDPAIVGFLAARERLTADEIVRRLNTQSGLLGVSGRSADVRDLLAAEQAGDDQAALALEMFCYRARKYIGAYAAVLGGVDAIAFGGGIGENAPAIRQRILEGMSWAGLELDPALNKSPLGADARISAGSSRIGVYVVSMDEESVIARETYKLLQRTA